MEKLYTKYDVTCKSAHWLVLSDLKNYCCNFNRDCHFASKFYVFWRKWALWILFDIIFLGSNGTFYSWMNLSTLKSELVISDNRKELGEQSPMEDEIFLRRLLEWQYYLHVGASVSRSTVKHISKFWRRYTGTCLPLGLCCG